MRKIIVAWKLAALLVIFLLLVVAFRAFNVYDGYRRLDDMASSPSVPLIDGVPDASDEAAMRRHQNAVHELGERLREADPMTRLASQPVTD